MKLIDLSSRRFGRLAVKSRAGTTLRGQPLWLCECDCGARTVVAGFNLRSGNTNSCGCLAKEASALNLRKAKRRGIDNPKHKKAINYAASPDEYIMSSEEWYKRAAGRFYLARKNNIPIEFSSAQDLAAYCARIAPQCCPVLNVPLKRGNTSIDRIDPLKGYVRGNIQIISTKANRMKSNATIEELRLFARWVGNLI